MGHKGNLGEGFFYLIVVTVWEASAYVQTHQTVYITYVLFFFFFWYINYITLGLLKGQSVGLICPTDLSLPVTRLGPNLPLVGQYTKKQLKIFSTCTSESGICEYSVPRWSTGRVCFRDAPAIQRENLTIFKGFPNPVCKEHLIFRMM